MVLDHDHNGALVQTHIDVFKPILGEIEAIAKAIDAPQFTAELTIEMFESLHRFLGRIWKGSQCRCACYRPVVASRRGSAARIDARRQSPRVVAITYTLSRISDGIRMVDQGKAAVVLEVVRVSISLIAGVKSQE